MIGITRTRPQRAARIVDMNLLPLDSRPRRVTTISIALVVGVAIAIALITPLAFVEHGAKRDASAMKQQAAQAQQSLGGAQLALARNRALQAQLDETITRTAALRAVRERLQGGKRPLADDLAQLLDPAVIQPGARILSVTGSDTGLQVQGTAAGPLEAIAYADNLMRNGGFSLARMASFAPGKAGGQFTIEVTR